LIPEREFSDLLILVTENGISLSDSVDPVGRVNDVEHIDYYRGYIGAGTAT
jgi:beta-glucosidase/6-phospho-beta-glucosidase/beta-galactosidase